MDVKSTFLHGGLHQEIYMEQPPTFIQTDSSLVWFLKKSLYGLKQAPLAWYAKMDSSLLDIGFSRCHSHNIVYTKKVDKSLIILVLYVDDLILTGSDPNLINHVKSILKKRFIILVLYVDDLILTGSDPNLINHVKSILKKRFEMTDLGHLHYFLSLQVLQSKEGISLSQSKYACDLLRNFHMEDCYVFTLDSRPITWACKKKSNISLSSAKAEYRGVVEANKEALWLHQILLQFGFQQKHLTTLWCDNQSVIQLCKDPVQHQRIKHIELHMHFIGKLIHDHVLEVHYYSTDDKVADIFIKALTEAKFTKL
eukprot:PITA_08383